MNIKLEIGLRFSPLCETITKPIIHKFLHPFTNEPLFKTGNVKCLSLLELVSEKLRAAILSKDIVSRDFYELDFLIRNGFDFSNSE